MSRRSGTSVHRQICIHTAVTGIRNPNSPAPGNSPQAGAHKGAVRARFLPARWAASPQERLFPGTWSEPNRRLAREPIHSRSMRYIRRRHFPHPAAAPVSPSIHRTAQPLPYLHRDPRARRHRRNLLRSWWRSCRRCAEVADTLRSRARHSKRHRARARRRARSTTMHCHASSCVVGAPQSLERTACLCQMIRAGSDLLQLATAGMPLPSQSE